MYVDQKGSVAMLTVKRSACVVPEVYLRNPPHAGGKACKRGQMSHKSKETVSVVPQKDVFFKNLEKNCQKISAETCFRKM